MSLQITTRFHVFEYFSNRYNERQKSFYKNVIYADGSLGELETLRYYYKNILNYSQELDSSELEIMFIGKEKFFYPVQEASEIALDEIASFLTEHDSKITLVVDYSDYLSFIIPIRDSLKKLIAPSYSRASREELDFDKDCCCSSAAPILYSEPLEDLLEQAQKNLNFQDTLQQMISERNLSNNYVYSRALIDRRFFSKIISQKNYVPKKQTVMALGLALELEMQDFEKLLESAGYAFMPSSAFDIVIKYCVENKIYNIIQINFILHDYGINTFSRM